MLVLSRHVNETIHIGDDVVIRVIGLRATAVRILIDAPRDIVVRRGELSPLPPVGSSGLDEPPAQSRQAE